MMRSTRSMVRATAMAVAVLTAAGALALAPSSPAGAAGVTTHAWMAASAINRVTDPQLKALLKANAPFVRVGAHFPDSGYALSNKYGEEAHWQRYHDAFADQILTHSECTDLTKIHGPCAPMIAFLMGMSAHGMGDEVWDWLFEPNVPDLNEYYTPSDLGSYANEGGAETQMDLVAIADYGQPTSALVPFPSHPDILAAFKAVGFTDVDDNALNLGQAAMGVVHQAEAAWTPSHIDALHKAMPWMSHNLTNGPGGVAFAAIAIAGNWNSMWGRLLGHQPATSVSITYPAAGQDRIPATGWVHNHEPGSSRGRGAARQRITAVLTYARPYNGSGSTGTVSQELPAGSMTLTERDSGDPVAIESGWPRSVPYGNDAGEHVVDIQPAADLTPCTWYRAGVTANLVDSRNLPVTPKTWDFRTGTDGSGHRCPDDPYTADENFSRKATSDLLDRPATEPELQNVGYTFARGRTRATYAGDLLASQSERQLLVTETYQHYLDRNPDSGGLAYWSTKLKTIKLPDFVARLAGSDEVYRKGGSTNSGYVTLLYQLVHGRSVDSGGLAYWSGKLDRGLDRGKFAKQLLTSHESAQRTVKAAYTKLLDRSPDPSGLAHWTSVLEHGSDQRDLWKQIIISAEYDRQAQAA